MSEQAEQLQERTMQFAVDVCELIQAASRLGARTNHPTSAGEIFNIDRDELSQFPPRQVARRIHRTDRNRRRRVRRKPWLAGVRQACEAFEFAGIAQTSAGSTRASEYLRSIRWHRA